MGSRRGTQEPKQKKVQRAFELGDAVYYVLSHYVVLILAHTWVRVHYHIDVFSDLPLVLDYVCELLCCVGIWHYVVDPTMRRRSLALAVAL